MDISPEMMRLLILLCMFSMSLLAAFFLRRRGISPLAYAGWGILTMLLPLVGPFLVVLYQPGQKPDRRIR
jgi:hypothetical protein